MEAINKKIKSLFILSLILSVAFVAGIPSIVFGATGGMIWLMVIGIIATVAGFYGMPISWVMYGTNISQRNIVRSIVEEQITNIDDLAGIHNKSVPVITREISTLIAKGYLKGCKIQGNEIVGIKKKSIIARNKCPNCGSPLIIKDNKKVCEYCSSQFDN